MDEAEQLGVCASLENDVIYIPFDALHVGECGGHNVAHLPSRCSGQGGFLGWLGHSGFEHMLLSHKQRIWIQMEGRVRFLQVGFPQTFCGRFHLKRWQTTRGMAIRDLRSTSFLVGQLSTFFQACSEGWNFHVLLFLRPTE